MFAVEQDLFGGISSSDEEGDGNALDDSVGMTTGSDVKPDAAYVTDSMGGTDDMAGK